MILQYFKKSDNRVDIERQYDELAAAHEPNSAVSKWIAMEYKYVLDCLWLRSLPHFSTRKIAVIAKHKKRTEALMNISGGAFALELTLVFRMN